jgi:hypothetical protein
MNYWALNNILLFIFLCGLNFPISDQLPGHHFIKIIQSPEWEIYPGQRKNLEVNIQILDGYHIQADKVQDHNLIPTSISTTEVPNTFLVYNAIFPQPEPFKIRDAQDSIMVFHGTLRIYIPVEVRNEAKIGQHKISMNLHYQACDSIKCYFPRDLPFIINVLVNERTSDQKNE